MEEFKALVTKIHSIGMHMIIDWVANHSSRDNLLVAQHPDWYTREGNFQSTPWRDYNDIIDFNCDKPELRKSMTEALEFWVKGTGIDGYKCNVASFVPIEF